MDHLLFDHRPIWKLKARPSVVEKSGSSLFSVEYCRRIGGSQCSNPFLEGHGPQVGKPVDGRLGSLRYLGWQGVGRFHYERSGLDVL